MKHLKKKTKSNIVSACAELAEGYKNDELSHRLNTCPMCVIYHDQDNSTCDDNCLNQAFKNFDKFYACDRYPCNRRRSAFPNLNWNYNGNNQTLSVFWTKVGAYLQKKDEADILNMTVQVRERIIEIARDVNKL